LLRFKKFLPSNKLSEYVESYFIAEYDPNLPGSPSERFMTNHPQGTFDLMFALRGGLEMKNHKNELFEFSQIFVMAQQEGFFNVKFKDDFCLIGVVFYAESFSKLFNFPFHEIVNGGRRLDDELSSSYLEMHERLQSTIGDQQRINLLNTFIEHQLAQVDFSFTKFDQLIKSIRLDGGSLGIKDMADQSNLSQRTLQRNMKSLIGVGPKSYSNVMRFKKVLEFIHNHPSYDWQDVLYLCGYYDQAHFIRDFKKYTGKTPRAFTQGNENLSSLFLDDKKAPSSEDNSAF
jgi:AraC-like DNA-binding protein